MKHILTSNNKHIYVYDNLLTYKERCDFLDFLKNSFYRVDGGDTSLDTDSSYQVYSAFNNKDVENSGLLETEGFKFLDNKYNLLSRKVLQIRTNFTTYAEKNTIHQDSSVITLLYYPNLDWKLEWGGHLFFISEDLSTIEHTLEYKPGRIVIFDGTVPHLIMTPTVASKFPRLSFAIQFGSGDKLDGS